MTDIVTIDIDCGIADVRLNRPEKYNALSGDMFTAIIEAGESLASAMDVRAVVLSGNGPGFCAGLDFDSFQGMADAAESGGDVGSGLLQRDDRPETMRRGQRMFGKHYRCLSSQPYTGSPTVAVVKLRSARIFVLRHQKQSFRSWRSNGELFQTCPLPKPCVMSSGSM